LNVKQKITKNKFGLLELDEKMGNVSKAFRIMGFSRDIFYRYQSALQEKGIENLLEKNKQGLNMKPSGVHLNVPLPVTHSFVILYDLYS